MIIRPGPVANAGRLSWNGCHYCGYHDVFMMKGTDTMTDENSLADKASRPRPRLGPAFLSFLLPGLGQLVQGRFRMFWVFCPLYVYSAAFGLAIFFEMTEDRISFPGISSFVVFLLFFMSVPLLTLFYAVADALLGKRGEPSPVRQPMRRLAIIAVPYSVFLFLPVICGSAREAARRMVCCSNLNQIAFAFLQYQYDYGVLPPAWTVDAEGKPLHSWRVLILPYLDLEEKELYDAIRLDEPWDSEHNRQFHDKMPRFFRCPTALNNGFLSSMKRRFPLLKNDCYYSVIVGEETMFPGAKSVSLSSVSDKPEETLLVTERMMPVPWMDPTKEITAAAALAGVNADLMGIGSFHPGGCNVAMANGSARFIPETYPAEELRAILTVSAGESKTLPKGEGKEGM